MLAVHFGAGNIGRGFIGSLLSDAGYEVCFVDVNGEVVDLLNGRKEYRVVLAADTREEKIVKNVFAVNSMTDKDAVVSRIAEADLVTTAVGPNILPLISGLIAAGLKKRAESSKRPLNIIACENMIGGSTFLKESVYDRVGAEEKVVFDELYGFPDAAVDRIVPNQVNEDKLMVSVEPFFEWVVDETKIVGEKPEVAGITYVENLSAYIERKLFTVNTGHAVTAYLGYKYGLETVKQAMENEEIKAVVRGALNESGAVLVKKYGFDAGKHAEYIEKILSRFENPHISDEVTRVARGPLRKLGGSDRLVGPAAQYFELLSGEGEGEPLNLAKGIAAALTYDYTGDDEAVQLQKKIAADGYEAALHEISRLGQGHPLVGLVMKQLGDKQLGDRH